MVVGYNREDVRPRCDVCAVGGVGASASCIPVFFTTWGTRATHTHMTNPPFRVMEPEAMELSRTTFAWPSWRLSGMWDEESAYEMKGQASAF